MVNRFLSQSAKYLTDVTSVCRHHDSLFGDCNGQEAIVRQLLQAGVVDCSAYDKAIVREDMTAALIGGVRVQQQADHVSTTWMFSSGHVACQYSTG